MTKKELIQRIGRDCRASIRATLRGGGERKTRELPGAEREPRPAIRRRRRK